MHQAFADDDYSLSDLSADQVIGLIEETGLTAVSAKEAMAHVQDVLIERTDLTAADFAASDGLSETAASTGHTALLSEIGHDIIHYELARAGQTVTPASDSTPGVGVALGEDGGDILDLRDLLQGEDQAQDNLADYLHFEQSGADTIVHISSQGNFANGYVAGHDGQSLILQELDLTGSMNDHQIIQDMLTKGKLVTD